MEWLKISELQDRSKVVIDDLRSQLAPIVPDTAIAIVAGSYARREASPLSDIDYFTLTPGEAVTPAPAWDDQARTLITKVVSKGPSADGAFGRITDVAELTRNIGGDSDDNRNITRRMLLLLEGEWLTNEIGFNALRHKILEEYAEQTPNDHQMMLFLLNDLVRYWRTITVDYAHKTARIENPKPWAIRNIKLAFSRKLLFASGLFAVAETVDRMKSEKIEILDQLFSMPAVDRLLYVGGRENMRRVMDSYDMFLERMSRQDVRDRLDEIGKDQHDTSCEVFRSLKNEAHHFSRYLMDAFQRTFNATHPIHLKVVF